jgi:pyridoxamine 5'-phosphate oxidase
MPDPRSIDAPTGVHPDRTLDRDDLLPDPVGLFLSWLELAEREGVEMPNAMALATADADGRPSVRHVLLRGVDPRGFVFFTNRESRKGRDLSVNPHAAGVLLWKELDRQVTVAGPVERVADDESDAYFASRPREAQIGAWASQQSRPIADRETLELQVTEAGSRTVTCPGRPTGAGTGSCLTRWSSGKAVSTGSTTGSGTCAMEPAGGSSA